VSPAQGVRELVPMPPELYLGVPPPLVAFPQN
jgi:hypothetical protein